MHFTACHSILCSIPTMISFDQYSDYIVWSVWIVWRGRGGLMSGNCSKRMKREECMFFIMPSSGTYIYSILASFQAKITL